MAKIKSKNNKNPHDNRTTTETITFHKIKLPKRDKNNFTSHLPQVWGYQLIYCLTFMTKMYNMALGRDEE